MGDTIQLGTSRMQCIGAYVARPDGTARGGIVVVQEIFGVTGYVRSVADRFAAAGFVAIAPAFFDHVETGLELPYDDDGMRRGRELAGAVGLDQAVSDVGSAAQAIASAGRVGCVGFCWGGSVALLAATRLGLPSVSYYGARNTQFLDEPLKAPLMIHVGANDPSIPAEAVERQRAAWPDAIIHVYPGAGHAFDRDVDPKVHDPASAASASDRSLAFLRTHLEPTAR